MLLLYVYQKETPAAQSWPPHSLRALQMRPVKSHIKISYWDAELSGFHPRSSAVQNRDLDVRCWKQLVNYRLILGWIDTTDAVTLLLFGAS